MEVPTLQKLILNGFMNRLLGIILLVVLCTACEKSNYADSVTTVSLEGGEDYEFTTYKSRNSTTFLWDFGDGSTSTLEDPIHSYSTPGKYSVVLSAFRGGKLIYSRLKYLVTVKQLFKPRIDYLEVYPSGIVTVNEPTNFHIELNEDLTASQYDYAFYLDGVKLYQGESRSLYDMKFTTSGYYDIQCKIFDKNDMSGTYDTTIFVQN